MNRRDGRLVRYMLSISSILLVFIFLMKLLPCLSHSFRSPIVGFYQQWAFVVLHNLDSDATYPNVICRSILCYNYFIFNVRRYSFCSGMIL